MRVVWEKFNFEYDNLNKQWNETDDEDDTISTNNEGVSDLEAFFNDIEHNVRTGVATPFGVFDIVDPFAPFTRFELWVGHTDFNVDKNFISALKEIQGIEIIKPISRYSFLIGCGKLFDFKDVRISVELMIGMHADSKLSDIQNLVNSFGDKKYAVYMYPNGEFNYTTNEDLNFLSKIKEFEREKENSSGVLLRNV